MIRIFAIHFNRPDFVDLQYSTLKHFLKDDFEYVVVNNANHPTLVDAFEAECQRLEVRSIRISENLDANSASAYPGYHHSNAMNALLQNELTNCEDICVILDGDAFLLKEYSFEDRMSNSSLLGSLQQRQGRYWLTPVVIGMKPSKLPDFDSINLIGSHICNLTPDDATQDVAFYPKKIGNNYVFDCPACVGAMNLDQSQHIPLDTGGQLYMYLKSHENVKVKRIPTTSHIEDHCVSHFPELLKLGYDTDFRFEFYDNSFLHYCRSSNWDRRDQNFHERKSILLRKVIEHAFQGIDFTSSQYELSPNDWNGWPQHALNNHVIF